MAVEEQLFDMLKTIDEAGDFLRRRCAAGLAGQSLALFQDLSSLIELIGERFEQTEYLPKRLPSFRNRADALTAIAFLDQVDDWSRDVRDRVQRKKMRRGLARGSRYDAAEAEGKPFVNTARELAGMFRTDRPSGPVGSPEERAAADAGITVSFSGGGASATKAPDAAPANLDMAASANANASGVPMAAADEASIAAPTSRRERVPARPRGFDATEESTRLIEAVNARSGQSAHPLTAPPPGARNSRFSGGDKGQNVEDVRDSVRQGGGARPMGAPAADDANRLESADKPADDARPEPRRRGARSMEMSSRGEDVQPKATPASEATPVSEATPASGLPGDSGTRPMGMDPATSAPIPGSMEGADRPERPARRSRSRETAEERFLRESGPPQVKPGAGNAIDRNFSEMMEQVAAMDEGELAQRMVTAFPKLENRYKMVITDTLSRFPQLGRLSPDRNEFGALRRRAAELVNHRIDFLWLYGKLGDFRSKKTLLAILDNWFSFNFKDLANMKERMFAPYLDADLIKCGSREVFVDLGAYIGEVSRDFAALAGTWEKIYCYEAHEGTFASLRGNLSAYPDTELRNRAVDEKAGTAHLYSASGDPAESRLDSAAGGDSVATVTLDADVTGRVSIIKMCLGGGEQAAIRGCADHIHRDHPRMAIRADFTVEDLWKLPRMIERLNPKYQFYLRHYGGNLIPAEFVLYAI